MAKIIGIENMNGAQLSAELQNGGRFVVYEYVISILIMTFYRSSNITLVKADENGMVKGLGFTFLTLLLGWWGIPWGPIRSVQALVTNFKGGKDVTDSVMSVMKRAAQANVSPQ